MIYKDRDELLKGYLDWRDEIEILLGLSLSLSLALNLTGTLPLPAWGLL
jgi:hypothetical protein